MPGRSTRDEQTFERAVPRAGGVGRIRVDACQAPDAWFYTMSRLCCPTLPHYEGLTSQSRCARPSQVFTLQPLTNTTPPPLSRQPRPEGAWTFAQVAIPRDHTVALLGQCRVKRFKEPRVAGHSSSQSGTVLDMRRLEITKYESRSWHVETGKGWGPTSDGLRRFRLVYLDFGRWGATIWLWRVREDKHGPGCEIHEWCEGR